jgi:hypothetical protein
MLWRKGLFVFLLVALATAGITLVVSGRSDASTTVQKSEIKPPAKAADQVEGKAKLEPQDPAPKPEQAAVDKAAVPADPNATCAIGGDASQLALLQQQVSQLQAQLTTNSQAMKGQSQSKYGIKNLPSGNYRERCFACGRVPGEDGEPVLSCICPSGQMDFAGLMLDLSQCQEGQEVSYCGSMLVCGPCKLDNNLGREPLPSQTQSDSERLDKSLGLDRKKK